MPTHFDGTETERLALDAFIKLTRATESTFRRLMSHNTLGDLTVTQLGVLESVYHLGPMPQNVIGRKLLKSGGNITLVVDILVKRDLVRRDRADYDRRVMLISLTDVGRELIESILPRHVQAIVEVMGVLDQDEQKALARLCRKLGLANSSLPVDRCEEE